MSAAKGAAYTLTVYRRGRHIMRRWHAYGHPRDIRTDAARVLVWLAAERVTIRTPVGRYLPPVQKCNAAEMLAAASFTAEETAQ